MAMPSTTGPGAGGHDLLPGGHPAAKGAPEGFRVNTPTDQATWATDVRPGATVSSAPVAART
ncbi:hypothetical protein GA0115253_102371 [Streptomyces sp. Termitarium-T10T-6]|nr:hypothetical protein GA0115253_102371 [Streptomyces sp. Termitarium-T10T-6]